MARVIRGRKAVALDGAVALLERRELQKTGRPGDPRRDPAPTSPGRRREDSRRRFVATLAHEVRAPLAAIRNYTEVLLNCPPTADAERRSFLRAIAEESERLNRLLEELNLLEKLESGEDEFLPSPCDLGDAATSAALGMHPLASKKNVNIQIGGQDQAPLVWGEPNLIARAVLALIENAVRFSHPGGTVFITLGADFETRTATIAVADQGIGVSAGMERRIFEKFTQAAVPPDEVSPRGSGLGLALVEEIAQRHGGRATCARSEPGSIFSLTLPLCC